MEQGARRVGDEAEDPEVQEYLARASGRAFGLSIGLVGGLVLFSATMVLVVRGGENVGAHLRVLSDYLPFYDVTVFGAFLGFGYAFAIGYLLGRLISAVYNFAARK